MQPWNTVDSSINLADPVFLGVITLFVITVLLAFGRWLWLLAALFVRRGLTRRYVVELVALSIPLAALAVTFGYIVFVFSEAAR